MLIRADARHLPLADGCVHCVVTSPPYWGLRDYGDEGQIGLEPTPEAYVASIISVFAEAWRVLKNDGTVWLNLGDCYASSPPGNKATGYEKWKTSGLAGVREGSCYLETLDASVGKKRSSVVGNMKPKDLIGIPWRVAFALQAVGWYLRSDIIWSKPNPMPESVTDRPTKAHEYLFLLAKSARYYYDADAIREPFSESTLREAEYGYRGTATKEYLAAGAQDPSETKKRIVETIRCRRGMVAGVSDLNRNRASYKGGSASSMNDGEHVKKSDSGLPLREGGRNKRSVWTVNTMPYAGAHFATMPEALVEPCILAGCPIGGLVLDPFIGSGTVGAVAERLGRRWVGTDLSYQPLAAKRTAQRGIPFEVTA